MAEALGLADDEILRELQALGYTSETVSLLHLAPLIQVAWAGGKVTEGERRLIYDLARSRSIEADSPADQRLTEWLDARPAGDFLRERCGSSAPCCKPCRRVSGQPVTATCSPAALRSPQPQAPFSAWARFPKMSKSCSIASRLNWGGSYPDASAACWR
jgi:hypothetical protein